MRLFFIFLVLGLFALWTFRTVSLPPALRDLFEEDETIAAVAVPLTEEERLQQELARLPAPPENHAPEVAALLQRLRALPPVPAIVQIARQRDASLREGETAPPWSPEELAAESRMAEAYLKAWEPFFASAPIAWEKYPDSARLFRSQLSQLKEIPPGYGFSNYFLLFPDFNLYRPLRHLGALRFGTDFLLSNGWAGLDTVSLAETTRNFFMDPVVFTESSSPESTPPPPRIEDIRLGLRSDHALFLSAAGYLETLAPETPALIALQRFLGDRTNAEWFLERISGVKTSSQLARHLRRDADQILSLENKTFLSAPAWRQWLENASSGLSPALRDSLGGLRDFERIRFQYQVSTALLQALEKIQAGDVRAAERIMDPAQPQTFLRVEEGETGFAVSSALPPPEDASARTTILVPPPAEAEPSP